MEKILSHREWRGPGDTMYDYFGWLCLWVHILSALPKAPEQSKAFFLRLPADMDLRLTGLGAFSFRYTRRLLNASWKRRLSALRKGTAIFLDPSVPAELMAGFPELTGIPMDVPGLSLSCALPLSADGLLDCIRAVEAKSSKKFDWDAFFFVSRQSVSFFGALESVCGCIGPVYSADIRSPRAALESMVRRNNRKFSEN